MWSYWRSNQIGGQAGDERDYYCIIAAAVYGEKHYKNQQQVRFDIEICYGQPVENDACLQCCNDQDKDSKTGPAVWLGPWRTPRV